MIYQMAGNNYLLKIIEISATEVASTRGILQVNTISYDLTCTL